jgi:hypothetical protein
LQRGAGNASVARLLAPDALGFLDYRRRTR